MVNNIEIATYNSVFKVGVVCSVDGRTVKIRVDKNKNSSHLIYKGTLVKNVSVGSYVKILKGFVPIIGKVETENIVEANMSSGADYHDAAKNIGRLLVVKLIGYLEGRSYCKGVNELPLIDNECFLLTQNEFNKMHSFGGKDDEYIRIGTLANDPLVPIKVGIGRLFSSHIGIFGNTGSGKSYTLSKIYRQLFIHYSNTPRFKTNSKFLFFDFNGEYSKDKAVVDGKKVYNLSTRKEDGGDRIPLEAKDLLDLNLLCIFANATEKTQRPFIKRSIDLYKNINGDETKFKNYLYALVKQILAMSDKVKGDLLIDYVADIVPRNFDPTTNIDLGIKNDFWFHTKVECYYTSTSAGRFINLRESQGIIAQLTIAKKVQEFHFSANPLTNFIYIMYMRLIYDVLENRAVNEHIAPAIHKLQSAEKDIGKVLSF